MAKKKTAKRAKTARSGNGPEDACLKLSSDQRKALQSVFQSLGLRGQFKSLSDEGSQGPAEGQGILVKAARTGGARKATTRSRSSRKR